MSPDVANLLAYKLRKMATAGSSDEKSLSTMRDLLELDRLTKIAGQDGTVESVISLRKDRSRLSVI